MIAFLLGLGAGIVLGILTTVVETSRLAFGPLAFYGNGALIVPSIGAGLGIYAIWTWIVRSGRARGELLWSALGLLLGVVVAAGLVVVLIAPIAAVTYAVYVPLVQRGTVIGAAVLTGLVLLGLVFAFLMPPLAVGLIVAPFLITAMRTTARNAVLLGGLLALVLIAASIGVPLLTARR
ncbi:MAG: hypothetical protein H0V71_07010 [Chloroflexi bacterium]|nr:hypothetical protein [Chloroflexota bacterium]